MSEKEVENGDGEVPDKNNSEYFFKLCLQLRIKNCSSSSCLEFPVPTKIPSISFRHNIFFFVLINLFSFYIGLPKLSTEARMREI